MQPNEQKQYPSDNQQGLNDHLSSTGSNIPEYLHMEPVIDPIVVMRKKRKRLTITAVILLLMVLIASIGLFTYYYLQQGTPQEKFYKVIEGQLQIRTATKKITYGQQGSGNSARFETILDYSDPSRPKMKTIYEYTGTSEPRGFKGEDIMVRPQEYIARVTKPTSKLQAVMQVSKLQLGEWYRIPDTADARNNIWNNEMRTGFVSVRNDLAFGFGMVGNYDKAARSQAMQSIRDNKVYVVKSVDSTELNGSSVTVYKVSVDNQKLAAINKQLMKDFGGSSNVLVNIPDISNEVVFWVDAKTQLVGRIEFRMPADSGTVGGEINYVYNTQVTIDEPVGVNDLP